LRNKRRTAKRKPARQNQRPDKHKQPAIPLADHLLSVPEAARLLGVSRSMVYVLIRRGDLRVRRIGSLARIRPEDLQKYIDGDEKG
jgi:excisionase family DNA binding protein